MPEGHTIHRVARDHGRLLVGHRVSVGSPQGRFAEGAARSLSLVPLLVLAMLLLFHWFDRREVERTS